MREGRTTQRLSRARLQQLPLGGESLRSAITLTCVPSDLLHAQGIAGSELHARILSVSLSGRSLLEAGRAQSISFVHTSKRERLAAAVGSY
jgi:hypothetical protein